MCVYVSMSHVCRTCGSVGSPVPGVIRVVTMWVQGNKLGFSGRTTSARNDRAISPDLIITVYYIVYRGKVRR